MATAAVYRVAVRRGARAGARARTRVSAAGAVEVFPLLRAADRERPMARSPREHRHEDLLEVLRGAGVFRSGASRGSRGGAPVLELAASAPAPIRARPSRRRVSPGVRADEPTSARLRRLVLRRLESTRGAPGDADPRGAGAARGTSRVAGSDPRGRTRGPGLVLGRGGNPSAEVTLTRRLGSPRGVGALELFRGDFERAVSRDEGRSIGWARGHVVEVTPGRRGSGLPS